MNTSKIVFDWYVDFLSVLLSKCLPQSIPPEMRKRWHAACLKFPSYMKQNATPINAITLIWFIRYFLWSDPRFSRLGNLVGYVMDRGLFVILRNAISARPRAEWMSTTHYSLFCACNFLFIALYFFFFYSPHRLPIDWLPLVNSLLFVLVGGPLLLYSVVQFPSIVNHSILLDSSIYIFARSAIVIFLVRHLLAVDNPAEFPIFFGMVTASVPITPPLLYPYLCHVHWIAPGTLFVVVLCVSTFFSLKSLNFKRNARTRKPDEEFRKLKSTFRSLKLSLDSMLEFNIVCVEIKIHWRCFLLFCLLYSTVLAELFLPVHAFLLFLQVLWTENALWPVRLSPSSYLVSREIIEEKMNKDLESLKSKYETQFSRHMQEAFPKEENANTHNDARSRAIDELVSDLMIVIGSLIVESRMRLSYNKDVKPLERTMRELFNPMARLNTDQVSREILKRTLEAISGPDKMQIFRMSSDDDIVNFFCE